MKSIADLELKANLNRRNFVKLTVATGLMAGIGQPLWSAETKSSANGMIYRTLGRTGEKVSAIGLGGYHIGNPATDAEGVALIRAAIDRGITFMDNSWDYHKGNSEIRMGKALRDGYRDKVFLMTKIDSRSRDGAAKQLDESLRRLQTGHIDLIQFHEIIRLEDPDKIFQPGGALEAVQAAKKAGKIRYIGFTGHKDPQIHLHMLEVAKLHGFQFDTVQMPLNVMDAHYKSFGREVLPRLVEQGIGVLGMKSCGSGFILKSGTVSAIECLHYALNLPTSVVINGIDSLAQLDQAFEATRTFQPMAEPQVAALLARTAEAAKSGKYEPFKTTTAFDTTSHEPKSLI